MEAKQFTFKVDFKTKNSLCMADLNQEDNAIFNIYLTEQGKAVDLTNTTIKLFAKKPDGTIVCQESDIQVTDIKGGAIQVNVHTSMLEAVGTVICQVDLWQNNVSISSGAFLFEVHEHLANNKFVESHMDVNLFKVVTEYMDKAVADMNKYKALVEGFVQAGVSLEGLVDIKAYIDSNLQGLKDEATKAEELIPQVNQTSQNAEAKNQELQSTISSAEAKKQEVIQVTSSAESKKQELIQITNTAESKRAELQGTINSSEQKNQELAGTINSAESKKQELIQATNTAHTKFEEVNRVINEAEQKKTEVQAVVNSGESIKDSLNQAIATGKIEDKLDKSGGTITGSLCVNDLAGSNIVGGTNSTAVNPCEDANVLWRSGFYDLNEHGANVPFSGWTWLLNVAHRNNNPNIRYGLQVASENSTNNLAFRTRDVNGAGVWQHLYHTGNKPTPEEIGASTIEDMNHAKEQLNSCENNINANTQQIANNSSSINNLYGWVNRNIGMKYISGATSLKLESNWSYYLDGDHVADITYIDHSALMAGEKVYFFVASGNQLAHIVFRASGLCNNTCKVWLPRGQDLWIVGNENGDRIYTLMKIGDSMRFLT